MEAPIGKMLGPYEIVAEVGRGGMATVYKAYQPTLRRYVALKVLPPHLAQDEEFVHRFKLEAQNAASLRHPNIVVLHDVGEADSYHYIVMEFLNGVTLKALIEKGGALPETRALNILSQIASALDYAHASGFVHRDVKPSNIIVGENDLATLTDFGIAKAVEGTRITQVGALIGTPEYMSPEQARGEEADYRTDIYSLGVVTFEMLSGRVPFGGTTSHAVLHKVIYESPPPLRSINPAVSPQVEQAVTRALAKDPAVRYASAKEFADATSQAALPGATEKPTQYVRPPKKRAVTLLPVTACGLIAVCLVVLMGTFVFFLSRIPATSTPSATTTRALTSATMTFAPAATLGTAGASPVTPQKRLDPDVATNELGLKTIRGVSVTQLTTGNRTRIFEPRFDGNLFSAGWSPDGKQLLVSELQEPTPYQGALWLIGADGGTPVSLFRPGLNQGVLYAIWSPDGRTLAMSYRDGRANQCPFTLNSNGSGLGKLSNCERDDYPRYWSEDGKWIVVWFERGKQLYAYEVNASRRVPLSQLGRIKLFDERYYPWRVIDQPVCKGSEFWSCE